MYLDIGNDIILNWDDIIIILTKETALQNLSLYEQIQQGAVKNKIEEHMIHSYIVVKKEDKRELYSSSFTSKTLIQRSLL